ncbi:unnamed protein product [Sphagnum jensenii]|uniref:NECAP PHear domain-containing protein n=1 Tax=Sphagnum jensenii TaxID=128206 RepID=A0ABP0VV96_9BRYO
MIGAVDESQGTITQHAVGGGGGDGGAQLDDDDAAELVLFQVKECYVYMIPPRKSAASYRADEWDINKWAWEGGLKVVSKGEKCSIRLEDTNTGELFAQAFLREDQPLPVEAVIDSSRFFVLRIEDTSSVSNKHAFIGLGFRERPQAYDFQAALFDHVKYMNKKKEAEEIEQEYQSKPSTDYSIKEGETLRLQLKTQKKSSGNTAKPNITDKRLDVSMLREALPNPDNQEECPKHVGPNLFPFLAPPPSPKAAPKASPSSPLRIPSISASRSEDHLLTAGTNAAPVNVAAEPKDCDDEDFGDFQGA